MKEIKVSSNYKRFGAFLLFSILVVGIVLYWLFNRNIVHTISLGAIFTIFSIVVYYFLVKKMKIVLTEDKKILFYPSKSLSTEAIEADKVNKIVLKRGKFYDKISVFYDDCHVNLYPEDGDMLLRELTYIAFQAEVTII